MKTRKKLKPRTIKRGGIKQTISSSYYDAQRLINKTIFNTHKEPSVEFSLDEYNDYVQEEIRVSKKLRGEVNVKDIISRAKYKYVRDIFKEEDQEYGPLSYRQAENWRAKIMELEGINVGSIEAIITGAVDISSYIEKYSALAASHGLSVSQFIFGS